MDESNILDRQGATVEFVRRKAGVGAPLDVGWVHDMPGFIRSRRPHRLGFYDVMLVTSGTGELAVGSRLEPLRPGTVIFTPMGQMRRWTAEDVDGLCCFFPPPFFAHHRKGLALLDRAPMFEDETLPARLDLEPRRFEELQASIEAIRGDLGSMGAAPLRARVHDLLTGLERDHLRQHERGPDGARPSLVAEFQLLVARRFAEERRLSAYADWLGVSATHLSRVCRSTLGKSGGRVIRHRVAQEARALLGEDARSVTEIGRELGFFDPYHFSRFFRRETGLSPTAFRAAGSRGYPPPARRGARESPAAVNQSTNSGIPRSISTCGS